DERLGRGAVINASEDHYAYFTLVESGWKIVYEPRAIVFHPKSLTTRDTVRQHMAESVAYCAFIAFNHPSKSLQIVRFLVEGIFGTTRRWRPQSSGWPTSPSIQDKLWSGLLGISAFLRSVRQRPSKGGLRSPKLSQTSGGV